jgi:hypothetical protein
VDRWAVRAAHIEKSQDACASGLAHAGPLVRLISDTSQHIDIPIIVRTPSCAHRTKASTLARACKFMKRSEEQSSLSPVN